VSTELGKFERADRCSALGGLFGTPLGLFDKSGQAPAAVLLVVLV
jgi:hypothetical protein